MFPALAIQHPAVEILSFCLRFADEFPYASAGVREERARRVKEGKPAGLVTPPGWGGPGGDP